MIVNKDKNVRKLFKGFEIRFLKTTASIILGALGAFAWETAISEILKRYIPENPSPLYWILYALFMTLLVVILGIFANKIITNAEKEFKNKGKNNEN